jgi:tetratricopeptide (TPR) repeat protein
MKLLFSLTITIVLAATLFAQEPTPGSAAAQAQAREELNVAARLYREGNFPEAQVRAERALLLDPENKTAPMYIARIIHAQYKPRDFTPENVAKAREAITAYQRILERVPGDEEPYKAVAYLYGAIKEDELQREWIQQRAGDVSVANDKRAEAYVVLASKDWDCSFKITELPNHKVTTVVGNKASVRYKMPKVRVEFEEAQACANRGLEMANMAIALAPENESAWAYKTNILLELSKLAEMVGEKELKSELLRQYEEALKETTKLSQRAQSNP